LPIAPHPEIAKMDPLLLSLVVVLGIMGGSSQLRPPSGGGLGRFKRLHNPWQNRFSVA
jgi:hypothetical protein